MRCARRKLRTTQWSSRREDVVFVGFPEFPSWLVRTYACFQAFVTYHDAYLKPIRSHLPMDFVDLVAWLLPGSEDYSESVDAIGRALETLEKQAPSSPSSPKYSNCTK